MLDLKLLQKEFEIVSAKLTRKGVEANLLEELRNKNTVLKEAKVSNATFEIGRAHV